MIKFIKGATSYKDYPASNHEIVFVGRSNVGKSSLINTLFGKVAYVGKKPGKTRMLNFFNVDNKFTVCDVPGYGFANRSNNEIIEFGRMMDEYFDKRKCLKSCVVIVDIRHRPSDDDVDMLEFLKNKKVKCVIVANKDDKLSNNQRVNCLKEISTVLNIPLNKIINVSCLNKNNIDKLKEIIGY